MRRSNPGRTPLTDTETGLFNEQFFRVTLETRIATARRHLRRSRSCWWRSRRRRPTAPEPTDPTVVDRGDPPTLRDADTACRLTTAASPLILEDTPENGAVWTVERIRRSLAGRARRPHAVGRHRLLPRARLRREGAVRPRRPRPRGRSRVADRTASRSPPPSGLSHCRTPSTWRGDALDPEFVQMRKLRSSRLAEGVVGVDAAEHAARLLGPHERFGGADAMVHLEDPAFEDAVLGPGAREVLHARDLDPGDVAGGGEAAHPVAVRVAGEVAGDRRVGGRPRR